MRFALKEYLPLIYIYIFTTVVSIFMIYLYDLDTKNSITLFLGVFSITFSILKLIRLKDFVEAFSEYDFITQKVKAYGYLFPFLEFTFGVYFLLLIDNQLLEIACLFLFTLNFISVLNALSKNRKFVCACLGDLIKVPLSKVSLFENITMILGVIYLILS